MDERECTMEDLAGLKQYADFYRGKRVFLTGHTGFKGRWLARILLLLGAEVTGYALPPQQEEEKKLFHALGLDSDLHHIEGDVRDGEKLAQAMREARPDIVFHLAAQPLVLTSYQSPVLTYETNVMGTVHLLEAVRQMESVHAVLNVTTDKVYENKEWAWGYRENEPLMGYDPYSNSKSCSELVTHSYKVSFLEKQGVAVSTARAGNVIGGGDFAANRIIPDAVRAAIAGEPLVLRHPASIRPYQHVLDPLFAYLRIALRSYEDGKLADSYNVGPDEADCVTTGELARLFAAHWGDGMRIEAQEDAHAPHEANFLKLDCSKLKTTLGWKPRWSIDTAVQKTVSWAKAWQSGAGIRTVTDGQIQEFLKDM